MTVADDVLTRHAALPVLSDQQLRWLEGQGVPRTAIVKHDVLVSAEVRFGDDGRFEFSDGAADVEPGTVAVIIIAYAEDGCPDDLAAWAPRTGQTATWLGRAGYLGDAYGGPRLDVHGGLVVQASVLDWLRADRGGLAIVDPERARHQLRDGGPFIVAGDTVFAQRLEALLTLPAPEIIVITDRQEAA